jgi:hypothetical protein
MTGFFLRFTNSLILAVIAVLALTGSYGLMWPWPAWMFEVHRGAAWALIALIPWKSLITYKSLKRGLDRRFDRSVTVVLSVLMACLALLVLAFGVMWAWRVGPDLLWLGQYADAVISWHWMIALGLLPLVAFHVWRRWPRPKRADFASRRAALRVGALGVAGLAGWAVAEYLAQARQDPEAPRRFTGSREEGSFSGLGYPVTNTVGQGQIVLDPATWRLNVRGAVSRPLSLSYAEVLVMPPAEVTATLDCTSGWYTTQVWSGLPLADVLSQAGMQPGAAAVVLRDVSGYPAYFTVAEAAEILLATHSGGQVFDHWHGFPLRAVVPSRRGWQWVKWLTEIEVVG